MGDVSIHGNFVNKFNHAVDNIINTIDNDEVIARKILERRENILKNKEDLLVNLRQENENLKFALEEQRLEFEDRLIACNSEMDRVAYQCNVAFEQRNASNQRIAELLEELEATRHSLAAANSTIQELSDENARLRSAHPAPAQQPHASVSHLLHIETEEDNFSVGQLSVRSKILPSVTHSPVYALAPKVSAASVQSVSSVKSSSSSIHDRFAYST